MEWIITITIIIVTAVLLITIYTVMSNRWLKTTHYTISTNIPKNFNGFKIAHISDFHNEKSKTLNSKLIRALTNSTPNIIVITGDLIDSRRTDMDFTVSFIKKIIHIAPIYYVVGNHESRIGEYATFQNSLLKLGVNVLRNQKTEIIINGEKLIIAGVDDPKFDKTIKNDAYVMRKQLQSLALSQEDFNILLSHRPELFHLYASSCANIIFCGHAHGGQFRFFGRGLYSPGQGIFPKLTSSIHKTNSMRMVISRGIGNSAFPFRFNNPPELVILTLKDQK